MWYTPVILALWGKGTWIKEFNARLSKFKASLDYVRSCFKKLEKKSGNITQYSGCLTWRKPWA